MHRVSVLALVASCGSVKSNDTPDGGGCDGVVDCAGVCNGGAVEDCAGVCNGTAELDACGQCGEPGAPCTVLMPDSETAACNDGIGLAVACPSEPAGQDGNIRLGVPVYVSDGETVTDSVTDLVWELDPPYVQSVFSDAAARCEALELGGETDWRLPALLELVTLLDAGNVQAWPSVFEGIPNSSHFWTATPVAELGSIYAIATNFPEVTAFPEGGGGNIVVHRCVRGVGSSGELRVEGNTVVDDRTNLVWESDAAPTPLSWHDALARCETLELAGLGEWRLPSVKELYSIIDATQSDPAISPLFATRSSAAFWTSTPGRGNSTSAHLISFFRGAGIGDVFTELHDSRCVHTRQ